jgi:hypothetical protein
MVLVETFFIDGKPVGKIIENLNHDLITFEPRDGNKHLSGRKWRSATDCRKAVIKTYTKEGPH